MSNRMQSKKGGGAIFSCVSGCFFGLMRFRVSDDRPGNRGWGTTSAGIRCPQTKGYGLDGCR
jgi:hypothetical protein